MDIAVCLRKNRVPEPIAFQFELHRELNDIFHVIGAVVDKDLGSFLRSARFETQIRLLFEHSSLAA